METPLKRLYMLTKIRDAALILYRFESNELLQNWLDSPQECLFGSTPKEVCLRGEGQHLLQWLTDKLKEDEDE